MNARLAVGTYRCQDVARAVSAALLSGATWVDTAPNYAAGTAEAAVRSVVDGRDDIRVSTKVGFVPGPERQAARDAGVLQGGRAHCLARQYVAWQVARSRLRLGRAPDLVFVHNPEHGHTDRATVGRTLAEAFEALEYAATSGRIGGYGVATWSGLSSGLFTTAELLALAQTVGGPRHHFRAVQFPVSLVRLGPVADALGEHGALVEAREAGLDVFASAPLAGGAVIEAMTEGLVRLIEPAASPAQAALLIALSAPGVTHVLLSASTPAHWADASGAAARKPLSRERLRRVVDVLGT
ncbi:aldo/keto reductase [Streptomyces sp. NPDC048182]|uniref:aldo/keto reductase n=1 Tax=Streptomyces sp. NPDC048182 TaxID=3365507 RepID=UPI00371A71B4